MTVQPLSSQDGPLWRLQMLMAAGYVMPRGNAPQAGSIILYHPNLGNPRIKLFDDGHIEMRDFDGAGEKTIAIGDDAAFQTLLNDVKPANLAQNLFGRSSFMLSMIYIFGAALFMTWLISAMLD